MTSLNLRDYDFPDAPLLKPDGSRGRMLLWRPSELLVVIGKGSKPEEELLIDNCLTDSVPVVRRGTGGCAVVISPDMLCISFALYTNEQQQSAEYFKLFNGLIIRALAEQGIAGLSHQGISDITLGDHKIAGTAIYRNRELVFYHAILNVAGTGDAMDRYLAYPPRTPDYRRRRAHSEFVTSLAAQGFELDSTALTLSLQSTFLALLD